MICCLSNNFKVVFSSGQKQKNIAYYYNNKGDLRPNPNPNPDIISRIKLVYLGFAEHRIISSRASSDYSLLFNRARGLYREMPDRGLFKQPRASEVNKKFITWQKANICARNKQEIHQLVLVAQYGFGKNENKLLHYLVYLKPSGDILLIIIAIEFASQHLFVQFFFSIFQFFIS